MELFKEFTENPSIELRNRIVKNNLNLVYLIANQFRQRHDFEDLVQVGFLELVTCVERFDIYRGYQFSSFAMPRIRGAVLHYIRDKSHTIKIPRQYIELLTKAKKLSHLRDSETAASLDVDLDKWLEAKRSIAPPKSLYSPVCEDSELTLGESIDDGSEIYDYILEREKVDQVKSLLNKLPEHQRQTLELIYFKELTNDRAAKAMGKSEGTIRRYKKEAIETLRRA